ncbi:MAG: hypothetical protein B7Z37_27760, partial [Verrucomicrobia bacterium 12-59-8]
HMHWAEEGFDREVRLRMNDGEDYFIFTFSLEGCWQDIAGSRRRSFDRPAGTMALLRYREIYEHRAIPMNKAVHLSMAIESRQLLDWLGEERLQQHPRLDRFLKGHGAACLVLPLTQRARLAVEQIRHCPFQGLARALAMEARCLDLLVEMVEAAENTGGARPVQRRLNAQDQERIQGVAERLRKSLSEPPTLAELARQYNLSESKLKAGFHQVFGTTTFGYLRQLRMEHARQLLTTGDCSILEAANVVGIKNPSHFASLFKQHFGTNPKQFQMNGDRQK